MSTGTITARERRLHANQSQLLDPAGVVRTDAIYTREQLMTVFNWGNKSWASARRNGMKTIKHGARLYVTGEEVIRYMKSLGENQ
ncbi:hypothetical protein Pla110_24300 [Polystyrenella longa]|uniref:Uncharacterized protein n=1 Tax=Polystyrenella longa TaxID=2528007 RepID=A0A518CNA8_9PLAN|nr:hypothetical protein [Polystyrenella longa]QDU80698.1 hypothetical protein Pla110_24300 [Polystyrenella longa]